MLKIKLEFEFEDAEIKTLFEDYEKKYSKKRVAALKADLKENGGLDDFAYNLKDEVLNLLGDFIGNQLEDEDEE